MYKYFINILLFIKAANLDPFMTVLKMRKARMKMVQKPVQYHYVIKCLADYVEREMGVFV